MKRFFKFSVLTLVTLLSVNVWGDNLVNGTNYVLTTGGTNGGTPTGWTNTGDIANSYTHLKQGNLVTTSTICLNALTRIDVQAGTYGGASSEAQLKFEWVTAGETIVLGTITPTTNKENAEYSLTSFNNSPSANTEGYFKISSPNATNSKYPRFKQISFTFSIGTCGSSSYSITYNCNGATSGCPSDVASGATALPNPLPSAPTKTGYSFDGWFTNEECTVAAVAGATLSANANLYAKWIPNSCTVNWSVNGEIVSTVAVNYDDKVTALPENPDVICGGKVFVGWRAEAIVGEQDAIPSGLFTDVEGSPAISGNTTFYAVFAKASAGGGSTPTDVSTVINTYATAHDWVNDDARYTSVIMNGDITATAGNNGGSYTGKYFSYAPGTWRFYQTDKGTLTITSSSGDLSSITLTFSVKDKGTLWYNETQVTSGNAVAVSGTSAEFSVSASDGTSGKIFIEAISVTYAASGTTYSNYATTCSPSATYTDYITDCSPVYPIRYACTTTGDIDSWALAGEEITITADDPEEEGYEFRGWTVTTDGGDPVAVNGTTFTMPADGVMICPRMMFAVTFNDHGNETVENVVVGEEITKEPGTPCDGGRRFMGWSTTNVTEFTQSAPAVVAMPYTPSESITLYAVYASKNGGKVTGEETLSVNETFVENLPTETFDGIAGMTISGISETNGWSYFNVKTADNYVQTKSKIQDLSKIEIKWRSYSSVAQNVLIKISSDGSNWTTVKTISSITASNDVTTSVVPSSVGDYFVRIEIPQRTDDILTCRLNFNYIKFWSKERTVWYSDYSTTCDVAASATMTFTNGGDQTTHAAGSVPENYTLPTPVWSGHEFVKWTIAGQDYAAGDNYVLAHDVTATGVWNEVAGEWTITGDVHLTSYKNVSVYTTNNPESRITISGSNLCVGHALRIEYYDGETKITTKSQSLFRVCDGSAYTIAEGNRSISATTYNETVAISYTPNAYGTTNTYKIRFQEVNSAGTQTFGDPIDLMVYGRSLPETFVVAAQYNGQWYALPADLTDGSASSTKAPYLISVDNTTTPTCATNAPAEALYKGDGRNVAGDNRGGIRLKGNTTGKYATATSSDSKTLLYMPDGNISNYQDWYLTSSDFGQYTIQINPTVENARSMRMYGGTIGYYNSGSTNMYILPVTNVLTDREAEIVEWGQHSAILEVDAVNPTAINKVVARIGATSSDAITLTQTTTSGKASATKYNYTAAFGNTIDFAANEGQVLYLDWKNGDATVGTTSIIIPRIIAANTTMSAISTTKDNWSNAEVIVLPGVTLTADAGNFKDGTVTIKNLEIYPGATLNISGGTLTTTDLVLRTGWTRATQKSYDVARVYINDAASLKHTNAYMDCYIDYDQYYPIAVPFPVTASDIAYRNTNSAAVVGSSVMIKTYDGAKRAETVQANTLNGENWVAVTSGTLSPSKGYAITAKRPTGKAFSILRMPLTFTDEWTTNGEKAQVDAVTKNTVTVGKCTSSAVYASGWNFVANPYMAVFNDNDGTGITGAVLYTDPEAGNVRYATIPTEDFRDYYQEPISTAALKPASAFFIQATEDGSIAFLASKRQAAPAAVKSAPQEIEAFISLTSATERDQMGLLIGQQFTADYDFNADLTKIMGEAGTLKTYLTYGGYDLAYVAVPELLAREMIPVVVNLPQAGEYTFSVRETASLSALEGLYLMDYKEGKVTNLLYDDYIFTSLPGKLTERFALNAVVGSHQMPTGYSGATDSGGPNVQKVIYREHFYIIVDGVVYDGKGSLVNNLK